MDDSGWKNLRKVLKKTLKNMSQEDMDKYFPKDTRPTGWISIEGSLPHMMARDIMKGYTEYKVKYKDETTGIGCVTDHNTWYYSAKEDGVTHWWHEGDGEQGPKNK